MSVTLYNFSSASIFSFKSASSLPQDKFRPVRHEYSSSLLHAVRLELVATVNGDDSEEDEIKHTDERIKDKPERKKERVLFSSVDTSKSVRPTWQHLNEHIVQNHHGSQGSIDMNMYKTLVIRLSIVDSDELPSPNQNASNNHDSRSDATLLSASSSLPFFQLSIHPSKMLRIPSIPSKLPLNTVIVHFSDDSYRIAPPLFQLLKDGGALPQVQEFSRFDDNVFSTLDQVTPVRKTASLLETDDESQATPVPGQNRSLLDDDDIAAAAAGNIATATATIASTLVAKTHNDATHWLLTETALSAQDLDRERQMLECLIAKEEAALQQEIAALQESKALLETKTAELSTLQVQNSQVQEAIQEEDIEAKRVDFVLEAQRIKLFTELRNIYRVTVNPEQRFFIQGLEIPFELYGGSVIEEEVSAALGYLAHLITMMSKYLAVQMRYRIYCFSSRSAIQDDRGAAFPLFQGRTIEREQLEHGVRLLDRNVECMLRTRGARVAPKAHVLAKVKRLYEHVIDGY